MVYFRCTLIRRIETYKMAKNRKMEDIQEMDNRMMKIQNFLKCQVWRQSFAHHLYAKNV